MSWFRKRHRDDDTEPAVAQPIASSEDSPVEDRPSHPSTIQASPDTGEPSFPQLIGALGDAAPEVREAAVSELANMGDLRAVEPLIDLLSDDSPEIRKTAVRALGTLGDSRAVEPLLEILPHDNWTYTQTMAETVAIALGSIGHVRAAEPLMRNLGANYPGVVRATANALGQIGDVRAVDPLIDVLEDESWSRTGSPYVREAAAEALGRIGDIRAVDPRHYTIAQGLVAAACDENAELKLRKRSVDAMEMMGDRTAWAERFGDELADAVHLVVTNYSDEGRGLSAYATGMVLDPLLDALAKPDAAHDIRFVDNGDGTVTDSVLGLVWQREDDGTKRKYAVAESYCGRLAFAGCTDWRLPTKEELTGLAMTGFDELHSSFPGLQRERYWAVSPPAELQWAENPERIAYTVDFDPESANFGQAATYFRDYSYFVRAVRGPDGSPT